jgi:hypothetical protein
MSLLVAQPEDDPLLINNSAKDVRILLDSGRMYSFDEKSATGGVPSNTEGNCPKLRRTPEDEMLLTEAGIDDENIIIYDITGLYTDVNTEVIHSKLKCFKNENEHDFYLILDEEDQVNKFNSAFLLTILKYMKTQQANRFIICLRKDLSSSTRKRTDKNLRFIGFRKLSKREQKVITITETHSLYNIVVDEEE